MIESRQVNEWKEQGRREGRQEGLVEALLNFLQRKFGSLPSELPLRLHAIADSNMIFELLFKAIDASDLDEFRQYMLEELECAPSPCFIPVGADPFTTPSSPTSPSP